MQKGGYFHPPFCLMFHPPFAYCLWSVVCRAGFGKPDLPSVWPAPGRIRFSGFCLIRVSGSRRWLHLRFPALLVSPVFILSVSAVFSLPAPPVPGVVRFFGFRFVRLCRFSALPAPSAPGVGCISGFRPCLFLRFPALLVSPVSNLTCSSGSRPCLLLRFPDLSGSSP